MPHENEVEEISFSHKKFLAIVQIFAIVSNSIAVGVGMANGGNLWIILNISFIFILALLLINNIKE